MWRLLLSEVLLARVENAVDVRAWGYFLVKRRAVAGNDIAHPSGKEGLVHGVPEVAERVGEAGAMSAGEANGSGKRLCVMVGEWLCEMAVASGSAWW